MAKSENKRKHKTFFKSHKSVPENLTSFCVHFFPLNSQPSPSGHYKREFLIKNNKITQLKAGHEKEEWTVTKKGSLKSFLFDFTLLISCSAFLFFVELLYLTVSSGVDVLLGCSFLFPTSQLISPHTYDGFSLFIISFITFSFDTFC